MGSWRWEMVPCHAIPFDLDLWTFNWSNGQSDERNGSPISIFGCFFLWRLVIKLKHVLGGSSHFYLVGWPFWHTSFFLYVLDIFDHLPTQIFNHCCRTNSYLRINWKTCRVGGVLSTVLQQRNNIMKNLLTLDCVNLMLDKKLTYKRKRKSGSIILTYIFGYQSRARICRMSRKCMHPCNHPLLENLLTIFKHVLLYNTFALFLSSSKENLN